MRRPVRAADSRPGEGSPPGCLDVAHCSQGDWGGRVTGTGRGPARTLAGASVTNASGSADARYPRPMDVDASGQPTTCRLSTEAERRAATRIGARHGFTGEAFLRHIADDPDVAARMVGLPSGVRLYSAIHDEMGSRG